MEANKKIGYYKVFNLNNFENWDENRVKNYLHSFLSEKYHVNTFLGSGASHGAVPLLGNTFDKFQSEHECNTTFQKLRRSYLSYRTGLLKDGAETNNDQNNNSINPESIDSKDVENFISWLQKRSEVIIEAESEVEVKKVLLEKIRNSIPIKYPSNDNFYDTLHAYIEFFAYLGDTRNAIDDETSVINLFTTNYDLMHEWALEELRFSYSTGFSGSIHPTFSSNQFNQRPISFENRFKNRWMAINPYFRVYKLHGSINWEFSKGHIYQALGNPEGTAVIYPSVEKHYETTQSPYSELIRELSKELQRESTVLFMSGYSFSDEHLNNLLKQAVDSSEFQLIIFYDWTEGNSDIKISQAIKQKDDENTNSGFYKFLNETKNNKNVTVIGSVDVAEIDKKDSIVGDWTFSKIVKLFKTRELGIENQPELPTAGGNDEK
ncbi:SIR2 family protein [Leuconostoc mesenteroides]